MENTIQRPVTLMKHPISTCHPRKALEAAEQAVIEAATSTRQTSSALMMESCTGAKRQIMANHLPNPFFK